MDIVSFLTKEEPVAGIEISDSFIRLCVFKHDKKTGVLQIHTQEERPVPDGAIRNGMITDRKVVTKILSELANMVPNKTRYAIVAIPAACTYIKLFDFPKAIQGKKLEETMDLTIGFQLPVHAEDVYLDWESVGNDATKNEVSLVAIKREVLDGYTEILSAAKITPVAIEPQPLAILRAIDIKNDNHLLMVDDISTEGVVFWFTHNDMIRLVRTYPEKIAQQQEHEIKKLSEFYASEYGAVPTVLHLKDAVVKDAIKKTSQIKDQGVWLASIGAAIRGAMPRAQDSLVSLMPIGTAEAYKRQRAIAFTELIANTTIALALFFSVAFMGTWALMLTLQQRALQQIDALSQLPIDPATAELERRTTELNALTGIADQALQEMPRWSLIVEELQKRSTNAIAITSISLPSTEETLALTGTASDRENLIAFKRSMEESSFFTEVMLPATNLELRAAIPFSLSFKLREPETLHDYQ